MLLDIPALEGVLAMPRSRRPSAAEAPVYTFRVRILPMSFFAPKNASSISREIEIAANQTLADLGEIIPLAFEFDDPHMWAFFLSGRAWDRSTEFAMEDDREVFAEPPQGLARAVAIRDVPYPGATGKKEFLFLFDFGDEWHFGVKLLRTSPTVEPRARYPRVVAQIGKAPPQYPDNEEDEEDEEDVEDGDEEEDGDEGNDEPRM